MMAFNECPVPILQDEWEFSILYNLFLKLKPKNILEIGSFYGGTLWYWLQEDFKDNVCIIDMPITEIDRRFTKMQECRQKWAEWVGNAGMFAPIFGDSADEQVINEAKNIFPNRDVDFLFIDGAHDYETVRADYENYSPLVRSGGMIVFHDIVCEDGVKKFWNEVNVFQKIIEIKKTFGIGIIHVF